MSFKIILNWSDLSLSGFIFGSGLVFLLSLSHFSLLSVVAYVSLILLFFGLSCKLYVHLIVMVMKPCKDPFSKLEIMEVSIFSENVQATLATVQLKGLCLVQNYLHSAKFVCVFYVATFIGAIFNTLTLLTIAWVSMFALPTIYEEKQDKVDEVLGQVQTQYKAIIQKVAVMLPAQKTTDKKKE